MAAYVRSLIVIIVLGVILLLLGIVPMMGSPPIPVPPFRASILHIPVSLGSMLTGPIGGLVLGLIYGLLGYFYESGNLLFGDPWVAIVPRLLVGLTPLIAYDLLRGVNRLVAAAVGGAVGALTSGGVMYGLAILRGLLSSAVVSPLVPSLLIEMGIAAGVCALVLWGWERAIASS